MLTPLDIHNQEFKRSLRGYDVDEVDEFAIKVLHNYKEKEFKSVSSADLGLDKEDQESKDKSWHSGALTAWSTYATAYL